MIKPVKQSPPIKPDIPRNIPVHSGKIIGIPIEEMEDWEDNQNKGIETPEPKSRQIE